MFNLNAWWHASVNYGDALSPYLIRKITGITPVYLDPALNTESEQSIYCVTGSLLGGTCLQNCVVYGLGVVSKDDIIIPDQKVNFVTVRGPISAQKVKEAGYRGPCMVGDPSLLLPRFVSRSLGYVHKLGILQSWVDIDKVRADYGDNPDILIVDMNRPVDEVLIDIFSCGYTICGCLHGLCTSIAYGIPTKWVKFSDRMMGDGTKFRDFLGSIDYEVYDPVDLKDKMDFSSLMNLPVVHDIDHVDLDRYYSICPFKFRKEA
jgi:pyruvyltransferase